MKIQKFLIFIQDTLLNTTDISIKTIRLIINSFESNLSNKEKENESIMLLLRIIREIGLKQISMKKVIEQITIDNLQKELNNIKG